MSQALGWAISSKQGTVTIKAICASAAGPVCKASQFIMNPEGFVQGQGISVLSEASPELSQTISAATNPQGFIAQELLTHVAKENPKAAGSLGEALTISSQLQELSLIDGDVQLDKKGDVTRASFTVTEEGQIGNIISKDFEKDDVLIRNTEVQKEKGETTLIFKENGYVKIKDKLFMNVEKGGKLKVNEQGEITEADITSTGGGTYELGGRQIQVEKDTRIVYKDGKLEIYGLEKTVEIDDQKINIHREIITVEQDKITGADFTIDEKRFIGIDGKNAEVTLAEQGYILGKNTQLESDRMIITSKEGNVLFSNMCGESSHDNYITPCKGTLTTEGKGFSVQLKKGRNFGLNIRENNRLILDMDGGKASIENGAISIALKEKDASIKITNGDVITTHKHTAEGTQVTTTLESIGGIADVEIVTVTESDGWSCAVETDEEGNIESSYCPSQSTPTTAAIADLTGMVDWGRLKSKCKNIVNSGIKNVKKRLAGQPKRQITIDKSEFSEGVNIYPDTVKQIEIESDCIGCRYYIVEGQDETNNDIHYILSIDENGVAGYFEEKDGKIGRPISTLNQYESQALGLVPPAEIVRKYREEERPKGELEYYSHGVWYMKDATIWQMQPDGTVKCVNCDPPKE